jgi:hypothetical protein
MLATAETRLNHLPARDGPSPRNDLDQNGRHSWEILKVHGRERRKNE